MTMDFLLRYCGVLSFILEICIGQGMSLVKLKVRIVMISLPHTLLALCQFCNFLQ